MKKNIIRVLIIDQNLEDGNQMIASLETDVFVSFRVERTDCLEEALSVLASEPIQAILLNLDLPDSQGMDTFFKIHQENPDIPVVIIADHKDDQIALEAVQNGVQDFLSKAESGWQMVGQVLRYAIERQQAQSALRTSEHRARALIDNTPDGFALLSRHGRITYASPSATRITGYSSDELIGKTLLSITHPDEISLNADLINQTTQRSHTPIKKEIRYKHKSGSWRWLELISNNFLDEPNIQAVALNFRDITDQKQISMDLHQKQQFLKYGYEMAHLGSWHADLINNTFEPSPEAARILSCQPGEHLWEDRLSHLHPNDRPSLMACWDAAKHGAPYNIEYRVIENGQIHWIHEKGDIEFDCSGRAFRAYGMCKDISERIRSEIAIQQYSARMDELSRFSSDVSKTTRFNFGELVNNITRQVTDLLPESGCLVYLFAENKQDLKLAGIYHPQADKLSLMRNVLSQISSEPGIHLFYSEKILATTLVELVQKSLAVKTGFKPWLEQYAPTHLAIFPLCAHWQQIGQLVAFRTDGLHYTQPDMVFLQNLSNLASLELANAALTERVERQNKLLMRQQEAAINQPKKILLIEDTEYVVMAIKDYLEFSGFEVLTAMDGHEGIEKAIQFQPDLILMDVQMPDMNGLEATQKIREQDDLRTTPVIALTALAMVGDRELCLSAGMNDYLSKPVNLKELVTTIQKHINKD